MLLHHKLCPHHWAKKQTSISFSPCEETNPNIGTSTDTAPSQHNYPLKAPPPTPSHCEVEILYKKLGGTKRDIAISPF